MTTRTHSQARLTAVEVRIGRLEDEVSSLKRSSDQLAVDVAKLGATVRTWVAAGTVFLSLIMIFLQWGRH